LVTFDTASIGATPGDIKSSIFLSLLGPSFFSESNFDSFFLVDISVRVTVAASGTAFAMIANSNSNQTVQAKFTAPNANSAWRGKTGEWVVERLFNNDTQTLEPPLDFQTVSFLSCGGETIGGRDFDVSNALTLAIQDSDTDTAIITSG
jgi:hypothetical protein